MGTKMGDYIYMYQTSAYVEGRECRQRFLEEADVWFSATGGDEILSADLAKHLNRKGAEWGLLEEGAANDSTRPRSNVGYFISTEYMWLLIHRGWAHPYCNQGYPGALNATGGNIPQARLTLAGLAARDGRLASAYDANEHLKAYRAANQGMFDESVETYYGRALTHFRQGDYISSSILLGETSGMLMEVWGEATLAYMEDGNTAREVKKKPTQ
jgi:hypothetical protein